MRSASPATALLLLLLPLAGVGCARDVIPNTDVEDTSENREVIQFVERYRMAMEERNAGAMMSLASQSYFDDNGTPSGRDDVDYEGLQTQLSIFTAQVLDVRYEIRYRRVTYERERVFVDFLYTGSFRVTTPEGERWSRRVSDNRLVLAREDGEFRILSGL